MTQYKLKKTKTEESIMNAYKRMEERIVASYFAIENSVVGRTRRSRMISWSTSWRRWMMKTPTPTLNPKQ